VTFLLSYYFISGDFDYSFFFGDWSFFAGDLASAFLSPFFGDVGSGFEVSSSPTSTFFAFWGLAPPR